VRAEGLGVVQVTHDLESALAHSGRILVLENGRGVACGDAESIAEHLLRHPARGLVMPPLARFAAGLRERGIDIPLTSGVDGIISAIGDRGGCRC
jgi:ABC-type glutathione transport system ATPase component